VIERAVHCPSCGTADTIRVRLRGVTDNDEYERIERQPVQDEEWICERCDHCFWPYPCPECGSYRIEGARGVSGQPFEAPLVVVRCSDCGAEFPPHPSVGLE